MQTPEPGRLEVKEDQLISVDDHGQIVTVAPFDTANDRSPDVVLPANSVLLPGLIDTHVHAPQWPQLGTGLDLPLDQWLFEYTFPMEARFADLGFARNVWRDMVPTLLGAGTTTAVYYGSIHEPATVALAEACIEHGQRAFVGRVAMDHPEGTPEWYRDPDASSAIDATLRSVQAIEALSGAETLVRPILTPRFIPACTDALLTGIGELAEATGTLVQTHCSENDWEHNYVLDRFGVSDTHALEQFGLVNDHTVLAHGVFLGIDDRQTLIGRGAGVAHCPLSNAYFGDAVFPARQSIEMGLRVGLGTDIAGGPDHSILHNCAQAVNSSRVLQDGVDPSLARDDRGRPDSRIDVTTAFWMATVGGAELLGLPVGLIEVGRAFDAIVIDLESIRWPHIDDWDRTFEKVIRRASDAAIQQVWVDGRDVTPLG